MTQTDDRFLAQSNDITQAADRYVNAGARGNIVSENIKLCAMLAEEGSTPENCLADMLKKLDQDNIQAGELIAAGNNAIILQLKNKTTGEPITSSVLRIEPAGYGSAPANPAVLEPVYDTTTAPRSEFAIPLRAVIVPYALKVDERISLPASIDSTIRLFGSLDETGLTRKIEDFDLSNAHKQFMLLPDPEHPGQPIRHHGNNLYFLTDLNMVNQRSLAGNTGAPSMYDDFIAAAREHFPENYSEQAVAEKMAAGKEAYSSQEVIAKLQSVKKQTIKDLRAAGVTLNSSHNTRAEPETHMMPTIALGTATTICPDRA